MRRRNRHRDRRSARALACGLAGIGLFLTGCGGSAGGDGDGGSASVRATLPACGAGPFFTRSPTALMPLDHIVPLGNLNPPGHTFPTDHLYFGIVDSDGDGVSDELDVRMPGDGWITAITTQEHLSATPVFTDYQVHLSPCSDYAIRFGHMQSLSATLQDAVDAGGGSCDTYMAGGNEFRNCRYTVKIELDAGTVLGTAGGRSGFAALDVWGYDYRSEVNTFANQARIRDDAPQLLHAACALDVFDAATRASLEAELGDGFTARTDPPVCGEIEQDVAGTAQGIWLREGVGALFPEDPHLALVHDNIDADRGAISIGTAFPAATGVHTFAPITAGHVSRDFSEVTPDGNAYCYPFSPGADGLVMELVSTERLLVEYRPTEDCSGASFSVDPAAAVAFVR